jgi:hypothetical protein
MHFSGINSTPPPSRRSSASLGHTSIHAGSVQARHTIAMKLLSIPPVVRTFIALFISEWFCCLTAAQTVIQEKHPRHLFISLDFKTFGIYNQSFR